MGVRVSGGSSRAVPFPASIDPMMTVSAAKGSNIASRGFYYRNVGNAGTISKIALDVAVTSGNICVAVFSNNGATGRSARPETRKATSGSVACPAVGYAEVSLGQSVSCEVGDWFYFGADNTTATFRAADTTAILSDLWSGRECFQNSAFPAPATASSTLNGGGVGVLLVGVA